MIDQNMLPAGGWFSSFCFCGSTVRNRSSRSLPGAGTCNTRSLSARAVADRAGLAVIIVIPLKAERDLFPALAEPTVGQPGLKIVFADRAGKHGDNLQAHDALNTGRAV